MENNIKIYYKNKEFFIKNSKKFILRISLLFSNNTISKRQNVSLLYYSYFLILKILRAFGLISSIKNIKDFYI